MEGKEIIPADAIAETRTPHSIMGDGGHMFNKAHFNLYGLGWFLEEYAGRKIVAHTGGVNGFVTSVCLVPEEKLGIIVLTNTDANSFFEALRNEIEDAYLGLPYRNYSKIFLGYADNQQKGTAEWLRKKKDTIASATDVLPLNAYAGTYRHNVYGLMTITKEQNKLVARFEHHKGRHANLELLGPGRFLATFNDPLYGIKEWNFTSIKGQIKSVTVRVADFVEFTPYEFIKTK